MMKKPVEWRVAARTFAEEQFAACLAAFEAARRDRENRYLNNLNMVKKTPSPVLTDAQFTATANAIMTQADAKRTAAGIQHQIEILTKLFVTSQAEDRGAAGVQVLRDMERLFVRKRIVTMLQGHGELPPRLVLRAVENAALSGVTHAKLTLADIAIKSVYSLIDCGEYGHATGVLWFWLTSKAHKKHALDARCPICRVPMAAVIRGWTCALHGLFGVPPSLLKPPPGGIAKSDKAAAEESYMDDLQAGLEVQLTAAVTAVGEAAAKAAESMKKIAGPASQLRDNHALVDDDDPLPPPGRMIEL